LCRLLRYSLVSVFIVLFVVLVVLTWQTSSSRTGYTSAGGGNAMVSTANLASGWLTKTGRIVFCESTF